MGSKEGKKHGQAGYGRVSNNDIIVCSLAGSRNCTALAIRNPRDASTEGPELDDHEANHGPSSR